MTRRRRAAAIACIALVAVVAVFPLSGVSLDWVVVPTAFVLLPTLTPTAVLVESLSCDTPSVGYLRAIDSRGPPVSSLA